MLATPRRLPAVLLSLLLLVLVTLAGSPARAAEPDFSVLRINEVRTNPNPDLVELVNTGSVPLDVSTLKAVDGDPAHTPITFAPGTTVPAGGYLAFDPDASSIPGHFGLGAADSITILQADGTTVVDTYNWTSHRTPSFARCPEGDGDFTVTTAATPGAANACATGPAPSSLVRVNEVESNGDKVADWVELTNTGTTTVDVSGWKILDADPSHATTPVVVPGGTSIAPGGFVAVYTEVGQSPGFGLGGNDAVTLYLPDGTTVVDTYAWTSHAATTYGRCPDGTGAFRTTTTSTRGAGNACSPVRLNEVESSDPAQPDFVELVNISGSAVDVSGWSLKDSGDADPYTFPGGTTVPAGGRTVVEAGAGGFAFGLGSSDAVRLFAADGSPVESYAWSSHATQTYGRCKDGTGDFVDTTAPTKGTANACPGLATEPWPGSQAVRTADRTETFLQDLSGLAFDPEDPDVLWAAQNKKGTLFRLVRDGQDWVPDAAGGWATGKDPRYTDGSGAPDTEGLTIGPDGFVYAAAERDNAASGVSRMSVLRYDPEAAGATLAATDEWDLTGSIPAAGANLGLEGVTWVPDSFLVEGGLVDQSTGRAYDPADYPLHGTGLYVVAVEDTGALHAFALDSTGGTSHRVATFASGFPALADVTFDPERRRLWAVTDDTVDGRTSQLRLAGGTFVVDTAFDRPAGMPNLNNEGFALAPQSRCVDGAKEVLWSDDGDTGGHSLRAGTITCTPPAAQEVAFTTTAPTAPVVGQTYGPAATGGASGRPVVLGAGPSTACTLAGGTVTFTHVGTCTVTAGQAAAPGYAAGSATQVVTVGRASTTSTVDVSATTVTATVAADPPGAGTPTGSVEVRRGTTVLGTVDLVGGAATLPAAVPASSDQDLTVTYAGSDDFAGSQRTVDRTRPVVTITGVDTDRLYVTDRPEPVCEATDARSEVVGCTLSTRVKPTRTTVTARATDAAGNVATTSVTYRTTAYVVRRAAYRGGEFVLERGRDYRLVGTVTTPGRVYGPARVGTTARRAQTLRDGRATIRIPRGAKVGSHWKVLVRSAGVKHVVRIRVTR